MPVETRAITPLPWRPAARQRVKGLACEAKATEPGAHAFNFYAFPNDGQPRHSACVMVPSTTVPGPGSIDDFIAELER